jgi:glycosyltransferase involved in cell wall biosynthesis
MIKRSLKIAFVHNYYIHYRVPLFELLAEKYNVTFFFDSIHSYISRISRKIKFKIPFNIHVKGEAIPLSLWYHLIKGKFNMVIAGDAINLSTIMAFFIAKLLRKPFILWEERWFWTNSLINNLRWPFVRIISLKADALIVPGSRSEKLYEKIGVNKNKIFIAPNASYIEISNYHKKVADKLKEDLKLEGKIVILYLGRIIKTKGVHILLKAFRELLKDRKNLFLIIAGEANPEYLIELYNISNELGLNTSNLYILGFIPPEKRGIYFELSDIVVYPSISYDAWGLVINEAMCLGKPVIATLKCGGAYDLILDGVNGFKVPAGDVKALYETLKKLIDDPELIEIFGSNSRKIILQKFTYKHMLRGFTEAINSTLFKE